MKKIMTIGIGIPAHNEEANIRKLLESIIEQKTDSKYIIEEIIVACDGCTDKTADIVRKIGNKDKRVKVIDDGKRHGQSGRLNRFYKSIKSDIFITFDADTRLASDNVVNEIARMFDDERVMLVGGNDQPDFPKNLIQKIGRVWVESWYEMRSKINDGDTVHNHKGCVSAGRMTFLRSVKIPQNIFSNDDFLYFSCKQMGYKFKFAQKAVVYYKIPSNFHEYMTQTTRFLGLKHRVAKYFGEQIYEDYKIPLKNKIRGLIVTFLRHPLLLTFAIILQVYQRLFKKFYTENYKGVSWTVIKSSKK